MPSRSPLSFTPSSSTSSSASSSFVPFSNFTLHTRDSFNASLTQPGNTASAAASALAHLDRLANLADYDRQISGSTAIPSEFYRVEPQSQEALEQDQQHDLSQSLPLHTLHGSLLQQDSLPTTQIIQNTDDSTQLEIHAVNISAADQSPSVTESIHEFNVGQDRDPVQNQELHVQGLVNDQSQPMADGWPSRHSQLLLSQPQSLSISENQTLLQTNPSEPTFTSIQSLGSLSFHNEEQTHDHGHDDINQESYFDHTSNHNTPLAHSTEHDRSRETMRENINVTRTYPESIQNGVNPMHPCPADTRMALSQVLTSFQDAGFDQPYTHPPITVPIEDRARNFARDDDIGGIIEATPSINNLQSITRPNFNVHPSISTQSTQSPTLPPTVQDDPTLAMSDFVVIPRLPRRRYATRDYSSSSVSSDDWLHHPNVVALANAESTAPEPIIDHGEFRLHEHDSSDFAHENQENITPQPVENLPEISIGFAPTPASDMHVIETPYTPMEDRTYIHLAEQSSEGARHASHIHSPQEDHSVAHMIEDLTISESSLAVSGAAEPGTVVAPSVSNEDSTLPLGDIQSAEETEPAATSASGMLTESGQPDRLGLLGPLLSSTRAASTTSSEDPLEFSLLRSTRPGFDSSILSMASRIRQARLMRLLRRMSERDALGGYPERYPWADTRSMINHASGSRETSRSGSLEDGIVDPVPDTDTQDAAAASNRTFLQFHDQSIPLLHPPQSYPLPSPSFTEILDCNGNSIEWSSDYNSTSSGTSSTASRESIEEHNEELDWTQTAEMRRRRRAWIERTGWDRGIVRTQGRSRIMSTGTAFEGMEFISEADNLLTGDHCNQSLKDSWVTNPNGECWSDGDVDSPQRQRHGVDVEDKDQEAGYMRRGQPLLGVLQSNPRQQQQGAMNGTGFYQLYSNVRNRYGPESARRRRVMSEMTDLLRREQEWERELEQYERELTAFRSGLISRMGPQPTDNSVLSTLTSSSRPRAATVGSSTDATSVSSNINLDGHVNSSMSHNAQQRGIDGVFSDSETTYGQERSGISGRSDGIVNEPEQGFLEYEQGNSHYHTQSVSFHEQPNRLRLQQQQEEPLLANHIHHPQYQSTPRQPTVAMMNRTPPPLPAQSQINEPIAHQIRRVHTPHMLTLQRRWEAQQSLLPQHQTLQHQQTQQQLQHQQNQQQLSAGISAINSSGQDMSHQRYPNTIFIPPPSQQELHSNSLSAAIPVSTVPLSRGNRSSFRTSHEGNGFQHFRLSGNTTPLSSQSATALPTGMSVARTERTDIASSTMTTSTSSGASTTSHPTSTLPPSPSSNPSANLNASLPTSSSHSQDQTDYRNQLYWRTRIRGNNSLYVNYEGGTLKPEEKWRRGKEDMVGR
ncbi:hypothetical protein BGX27_010969 [Mortierella sp. AM989]|nr:hypothetical protein BGX27_010969 [Mortierella sp. AM989]